MSSPEKLGSADTVNTVLIVEDDADALLLLRRALAKVGVRGPVLSVHDGEEAIQYLSGEGAFTDREKFPVPCVILLDLKLPRKSGLEVLEWVKSKPRLRKIPVFMLTSSDEEKDRSRAAELGVRDYHVKPVEYGDLLRMAKAIRTYTRLFCRDVRVQVHEDES